MSQRDASRDNKPRRDSEGADAQTFHPLPHFTPCRGARGMLNRNHLGSRIQRNNLHFHFARTALRLPEHVHRATLVPRRAQVLGTPGLVLAGLAGNDLLQSPLRPLAEEGRVRTRSVSKTQSSSSTKYSAVFLRNSGLRDAASPSRLIPSTCSINLSKLTNPQIPGSGFSL